MKYYNFDIPWKNIILLDDDHKLNRGVLLTKYVQTWCKHKFM